MIKKMPNYEGRLPDIAIHFLLKMYNSDVNNFRTVYSYGQELIFFLKFSQYVFFNGDRKKSTNNLSPKQISNLTKKIEETDIINFRMRDLKKLKYTHLEEYVHFFKKYRNASAGTINKKISVLSSFFKYLKKNRKIKENVAQDLDFMKLAKRKPVYLKEDQLKKLLNTFQNSKDNEFYIRDFCIFNIFTVTGIRVSELSGIYLNSIIFDSDGGKIKVWGKGGKERVVYFNLDSSLLLQKYIKFRELQIQNRISKRLEKLKEISANTNKMDEELIEEIKKDIDLNILFLNNRCKKIHPSTIERTMDKYLVVAGINKDREYYKDPACAESRITPHKFRHTAATMLAKVMSLRALQEMLGHESMETLKVYVHPEEDEIRKGVNESFFAKMISESNDDNPKEEIPPNQPISRMNNVLDIKDINKRAPRFKS
jgi:integrase/recombinase XerD